VKVLLKSPLNPHSGYGNDGLGIALALRQAGCDVYLDPTSVQTPLPPDVAELLTKRLTPPFDLLIHHVDPGQLGLSDGERRSARFTVAWSMWEMTSLDNMAGRSKTRRNLAGYDLVAGYDKVSLSALEPYISTNGAVVQGGYWPRLWPHMPRDFHSPALNFCMVGALGPRKDPFTAIRAFQALREQNPRLDVTLTLKTVSPGLHSKLADTIPGLSIVYDVWSDDELRAFYRSQHVLLAPSRGEGKNMPALEFLSTGGTVIATNWGGHTQWLSPSIGYPLNYTLGPIEPSKPNCLWAAADEQHLTELMLHAATHRDELARKGAAAADLIPQMCSWPKAIDRLMTMAGRSNERGQQALHRYRAANSRAEESRQMHL
jgi:glycosyltransferase involved in cell wall biosynthesis